MDPAENLNSIFFSLKSFYDAAEVVNHSNAREGKKRGSPKKSFQDFDSTSDPNNFDARTKS